LSAKAATAARAFTKILNRFEVHKRRSMTYDQGTEMAHYETIRMRRGSGASRRTRTA
jgi:IS30 family transposase